MKKILIIVLILFATGIGFFCGRSKGMTDRALTFESFNELSLYCAADAGASNWALAVAQFRLKHNRAFPENLAKVVTELELRNPKVEKNLIYDPWLMQYHYEYDIATGRYAVWSGGKNRTSESNLSRIAGDDVGVIVTPE